MRWSPTHLIHLLLLLRYPPLSHLWTHYGHYGPPVNKLQPQKLSSSSCHADLQTPSSTWRRSCWRTRASLKNAWAEELDSSVNLLIFFLFYFIFNKPSINVMKHKLLLSDDVTCYCSPPLLVKQRGCNTSTRNVHISCEKMVFLNWGGQGQVVYQTRRLLMVKYKRRFCLGRCLQQQLTEPEYVVKNQTLGCLLLK